jgi:2-methylfumaryl-CoA isomerase
MIVVVTSRQWSQLLSALKLEQAVAAIEVEQGVSLAKNDGLRFVHRDALFPLFDRAIGERTHAELAAALDEGRVVHSQYRTMLDAAKDPDSVANNPIFGVARKPSGFDYPAAGAFSTVPQMERFPPRAAPHNGQHSEEILRSALTFHE